MTTTFTPELPSQWESRGRWMLWFLLGLGILGALLLRLFVAPPGPHGSAVALELAHDEYSFAEAFKNGWSEDRPALCGLGAAYDPQGTAFGTLRCHLFIDSIAFVPGYAGLLVYFTMLLSRLRLERRVIVVHLLCSPAIAAGFFDIAENGMTVLAAEDLISGLLTDATVSDVRLASLCKWWLAALSFAVLAIIAWRAVATVKSSGGTAWPVQVAAAAAALCAIVLASGLGLSKNALLAPGMLPAMVALVLLAWWRLFRFSDIADRRSGQRIPPEPDNRQGD